MREFDPRLRMPAAKGGKNLFELKLLAAVGNINDFVRVPGLETMLQRGQIGCGVIETAVAFLNLTRIGRPGAVLMNQERVLLRRQSAVGKNANRALAFARDASVTQLLHDRV